MELSKDNSSVRMTRSEIMDCLLLPFDFATGNPTESLEVSRRRMGAFEWLIDLQSENGDIEWQANGDCKIGLVSAREIFSKLIEGEDTSKFGLPRSKQAMSEELHSDLVSQATQIMDSLES